MKFYNWAEIKTSVLNSITIILALVALNVQDTQAFPIYAQQAYANPREANGRIVCANCHLASKPTLIDVTL